MCVLVCACICVCVRTTTELTLTTGLTLTASDNPCDVFLAGGEYYDNTCYLAVNTSMTLPAAMVRLFEAHTRKKNTGKIRFYTIRKTKFKGAHFVLLSKIF